MLLEQLGGDHPNVLALEAEERHMGDDQLDPALCLMQGAMGLCLPVLRGGNSVCGASSTGSMSALSS